MGSPMFHAYYTVVLIVVFVAIWIWAWGKKRKKSFDEAARLPLEDDKVTSIRGEEES